jgi:hypothetical protein
MATEPTTDAAAPKNVGGRPQGSSPNCTPELIAEAGRLADAGNYFEAIFQYLDIPKSTAYWWREEGEKGNQPYAGFLDALEKGWARAEIRIAAQLQRHGQEDQPGQWTALAWFLERRFSDRWGRKQEVSLHGTPGKPPVQVGLTPEALALMKQREQDDDSGPAGD